MLGKQLTLDMYECDKEHIKNKIVIYSILDELPDVIEMTKITKPYIISYKGGKNSFDKGGFSGFVIIAESHISIHTFSEQNFCSIDIFSCKDFDIKKAEQYLIDKLKPKRIEKNLVIRGLNFPKEEMLTQNVVNQRVKNFKSFFRAMKQK